MTIAATLTMVAIMTFRLPGAAIAAYYTLLLSRETPISTVRAAMTVLVAYLLGAAYTFLGILLFVDYPLTHFLWVAFSVFLCFYVIKVTTNYVGSAAFAFIITIAIPIWDVNAPTAALVASTLWAAGSVSVGLFCTVAVEYAFAWRETQDELHTGLVTRTRALTALFRNLAEDGPDTQKAAQRVEQLAMVGVSRLRRLAASGTARASAPEQRSTTVALVGRMIDLAAALPHLPYELDASERRTLGDLADRLHGIEQHLAHPVPKAETRPPAVHPVPVIQELQRSLDLLNLSTSANTDPEALQVEGAGAPAQASTFVPDAFSNPDHLMYSLRGCLAAMLCYVIFNGVGWRGLSTSLATCVITALTSIGSSRQKQILRLSGAIVGGLVLGIGSQVLVLPMLDSLSGFTVLFVVVTLISGWFATGSPRISYFGLQIALAFYLIHLQEFYPQTNLAIARDRVMGVALGLVMMWLVFDTLGSKPAAVVMRELFAANLRLLAQFASPWSKGKSADPQQVRQLRDRISTNFGSVNAQADAVLFELGPTRERDLRLRRKLLDVQPRLRSLFFIELGLVQYRLQASPAELPTVIVDAQTAFDDTVSGALNEIADAFSSTQASQRHIQVRPAYDRLEQAIHEAYRGAPSARAQGVLAFSANLADILDGLGMELTEIVQALEP